MQNAQAIRVGDQFKTRTGVWEVIRALPGGKLELFNRAKALFQNRLHREVRLWTRAEAQA